MVKALGPEAQGLQLGRVGERKGSANSHGTKRSRQTTHRSGRSAKTPKQRRELPPLPRKPILHDRAKNTRQIPNDPKSIPKAGQTDPKLPKRKKRRCLPGDNKEGPVML